MYYFRKSKQPLTKEQFQFLNLFFKNCPDHFLSSAIFKEYPTNYKLIHADDFCTYVYVLLDGTLQAVEEHASDSDFLFTKLNSIDIMGDFELFTNRQNRIITLITSEKCLCFLIPIASYQAWIRNDPNALYIRLQMLIKQMTLQTTAERKNLFLDNKTKLLELLSQSYRDAGSPDTFCLNSTRENISEHLGCSLRTVNRAVLYLKTNGYISVKHGKIFFTKEQALLINTLISKPQDSQTRKVL